MKKLKKYLSFTMALIIAVAAFASLSVGAADAADPLDANLIIHYDFEGADILEAVEDKAPAGAFKDDVAPIAGQMNYSGLNMDPVNGTVQNTTPNAGLRAKLSEDTKAVAGVSTWFFRTKLDKQGTVDALTMVEMRTFGSASNRPFHLDYNTAKQQFVLAMSSAAEPSKVQNFGMNYEYDLTAQKYMNIAIVVDQANVDGKQVYQASLYVSLDLPKTVEEWTLLGTKTIGEGIAMPNEKNNLDLISNGSNGMGMKVTLDDVRLYNKALTLEEIATIIPNGSFDGQLKTKPADTQAPETQAPETQAPETQAPETQAPETNAPETNSPETNSPDTEAPAKSGCGATVSMGALAIVAVVGAAVISKKKYN